MPSHTHSSITPNTSETFRNVRPLQTAFTSNGLVSKRRRSMLPNTKSAVDVLRPSTSIAGQPEIERTSSLHVLQPFPPQTYSSMPNQENFSHGRPLREVVETAIADRSSVKKPHKAMPDTPMKPAFTMTDASSVHRTHRRGRSMGGALPTRSPLFPTPPRTSFSGMLPVPNTEAPRQRATQHLLGVGHPRTEARTRTHHRSASERIPHASPMHSMLEDPNDVFDSAESSPSRPTTNEAGYNLPSLRREQPVRRSRYPCSLPNPFLVKPAARKESPVREVLDTPMTEVDSTPASAMDSPNNCFTSPLATKQVHDRPLPSPKAPWRTSGYETPNSRDSEGHKSLALLHTGSRTGCSSEASPVPGLSDQSEEGTPITPTRKPSSHLKWFEAVPAGSPSHHYGGTVARKHKVQRPRHSEPVQQFYTPVVQRASALAQSEPANARHRYPTRLSQFEEQYVTESVLGEGEFSQVVKVREKASGQVSAVKRMKRAYVGPKDRLRRLEEVDVLCLLKQKRRLWSDPFFGADNVVELMSAWEEDGYLFLQTELCPLGSLAFVLSEYGRQVGPLDEPRLWKILAELGAGVDFIHKSNILHLDLKPANVLITEIGSLKITDFGMATRWPRCTTKEICAGAQLETRKFMPRDGDNVSDISFTPPSSPSNAQPSTNVTQWNLSGANGNTTESFGASCSSPFTFGSNSNEKTESNNMPERPRRRGTRQQHRKGSQVLSLEREGDREYIAPEVFFESKYGKPADLFSLGLILLEAACSVEIPDNGEPWHKLRCDDFSDVRLETLSPSLRNIVTALLSSQPYMRLTASELMHIPALVTVRDIMRRGLRADELDQLPAFNQGSSYDTPYPLPASKYYVPPPGGGAREEDRTVVRFRGAMIQEDEMAFMTEVLRAADQSDADQSLDTSTSLMTEDAPDTNVPLSSSILSPDMGITDQAHASHSASLPLNGMDIDRLNYVDEPIL
ncbi:non-specific serine/threonine protein kinase [Malassezia yamatoensis]|uniref:Non-specific serine/threonine protein kinase n=1 Tax=Malassezia yamatoensis TaxID=253288 RepID=A0AAJ5YR20_9BASI|nr:non-specific serine/threonine protein kinase [Malassezia yamatoensis]